MHITLTTPLALAALVAMVSATLTQASELRCVTYASVEASTGPALNTANGGHLATHIAYTDGVKGISPLKKAQYVNEAAWETFWPELFNTVNVRNALCDDEGGEHVTVTTSAESLLSYQRTPGATCIDANRASTSKCSALSATFTPTSYKIVFSYVNLGMGERSWIILTSYPIK